MNGQFPQLSRLLLLWGDVLSGTLSGVYSAVLSAPGFSIGLRVEGMEIVSVDFLEPCPDFVPQTCLAKDAVRQFRAWFVDPFFVFDLPLKVQGTSFQRRVWGEISAIPCGAIRTYGEVAISLNSGPRAVGGACGANPYPLVVPCHRVVAAGGRLGGFGGGSVKSGKGLLLDVKRWLLAREVA